MQKRSVICISNRYEQENFCLLSIISSEPKKILKFIERLDMQFIELNCCMRQRTEVVDDASWIMGFLDIIDPAIDSIKKLLNIDQVMESSRTTLGASNGVNEEKPVFSTPYGIKVNGPEYEISFDLDKFVREKLSLDPSKLDIQLETLLKSTTRITKSARKVIKSNS